jgi:acyl carrier protein
MVGNLSETELYSRVKTILQKVVYKSASISDVTPDTRLQEDLDIDSARLVDLVLNLEDEFGIQIEDSVIESIKTVADLVNLVKIAAT